MEKIKESAGSGLPAASAQSADPADKDFGWTIGSGKPEESAQSAGWTIGSGKVTKICENVYHIYDSLGVFCTLITAAHGALLVDTGYGFGAAAQTAQQIAGSRPITVICTHGHVDHIQGNKSFKDVYMHSSDTALMKSHSSLAFKTAIYFASRRNLSAQERGQARYFFRPNRTVIRPLADGQVIDYGGSSVEIIHTPGHTAGSVCILDRAHRVLLTGDSFSSHVWLFLKESQPLDVYQTSIEKVRACRNDFDIILSSHSAAAFRPSLLDTIAHCAAAFTPEKSTPFSSIAGKGLLYVEGFEKVTNRYGYKTFREFMHNVRNIDPSDIAEIGFASLVLPADSKQ